MQQLVVIHGGDAYETYEEYLESLQSMEFSLEQIKAKGWKSRLPEVLGSEYDVIAPKMPNPSNARYLEWKILFDKIAPLLDDNGILVGHSLGGIFLAKYLAEEVFPKTIKATFLVAAPFSTKDEQPVVDFILHPPLGNLEKQAGMLFLYHSTDDPIVPFTHVKRYQDVLPNAVIRSFSDRGHFTADTFPELIDEVKRLTR